MLKRVEIWSDVNNVRAFPKVIAESIMQSDDVLVFKQDVPNGDMTTVQKKNITFYTIMNDVEH